MSPCSSHDDAEPKAGIPALVNEFFERRQAGEDLTPEQFAAKHPEFADQLRAHLAGLAFIDRACTPTVNTVASGIPRQPAELPAVEGYELVEEIGRGGMGVVYKAVQASTKRKVAIKVMREGRFAGRVNRARFEREVRILGQLKHPSVVTVYDSGEAGGHFYYVMDYVSGQPLDVHMTAGERSIDQTLKLFAKICDAVNAAHLRGVIHRDLKPSNIRIDADGEPCVLDFGLAKVAASDAEAWQMTMTGQFVGSLPWASPEQAEGSPSKIDVRTDVYSLGVILYQMLTNKLPYVVTGSMRDVLENIMTVEPSRPSAIRREINDDVETIVLKALAKEPQHRYQIAGELARDIRHYLAGEPIEAKRNSGWYVLKKTLRLYKGRVAAGLVMALMLVGGLVATSTLYARAVASEARAKRRFDDVRKLANTFMLDFHDQIKDLPGSTPARESLVETALEYLDRLAGEAGDDQSLQHELAWAYCKLGDIQGNPYNFGGHLGDTEGAFASYRKALEILEHLSTTHSYHDHTRARRDLSACHNYIGDMQRVSGQSDAALASYRKALDIREALLAANPTDAEARRDLSASYNRIADLQHDNYRNEEALDCARKALEIDEGLLTEDPANKRARRGLGVNYLLVAKLLARSDRSEEALDYARKSLEIRQSVLAADTTNAEARRDVAVAYDGIGMLQRSARQTEEAFVSFRKSLEIFEALSAADPADVRARKNVSIGYERIGRMLQAAGQTEEALASFRKSLEVFEALSAADPTSADIRRSLSLCHYRIGKTLAATGQAQEALVSYGKSLEITEALSAANPSNARYRRDTAVTHDRTGSAYAALGSQAGTPAPQRLEHWRSARASYMRSLRVFDDMRERGILPPSDAEAFAELNTQIAKCDAAIAELEQRMEMADPTSQPSSRQP
ncbi:MAG TPA: serine/threonine-protein kinase [Phycisphaerae bacterium]|nr:serine/threonine-protein kinase [Phycisphaerae bacterium]